MGKFSRIMALIAVIALAVPLGAQVVQEAPAELVSNTARATAGLFGSDVDDSMDYHYYSGVEFNKWFGFLGAVPSYRKSMNLDPNHGAWTNDMIPAGNLGFATRFGALYLGAWYNGNIAQETGGDVTSNIIATYNTTTGAKETETETTIYDGSWLNSTNQFEFLIGIAGQGIKIGFFESMTQNQHGGPEDHTYIVAKDFVADTTTYTEEIDEYSAVGGHVMPMIGWGSNFAIGELNLRPFVDFGLDIYQESKILNMKGELNLGVYEHTTPWGGANLDQTNYEGFSNGYVAPQLAVGAYLDLPKKGETGMTVGLSYGLFAPVYSNDYDVPGQSGTADGRVSWVAAENYTKTERFMDRTESKTVSTVYFEDVTEAYHTITPSFRIAGEPVGGLKLGFAAKLPIRIHTESVDSYSEEINVTDTVSFLPSVPNTTAELQTRTNDGLWEMTETSFSAQLAAGASYALIPNRFTVNAGLSLTPFAVFNRVEKITPNGSGSITTTSHYTGGVKDAETKAVAQTTVEDTVVSSNTWAPLTGVVSGGFVFYFTEGIAVDLLVSGGFTTEGQGIFDVDVANFNVLFTFKF